MISPGSAPIEDHSRREAAAIAAEIAEAARFGPDRRADGDDDEAAADC